MEKRTDSGAKIEQDVTETGFAKGQEEEANENHKIEDSGNLLESADNDEQDYQTPGQEKETSPFSENLESDETINPEIIDEKTYILENQLKSAEEKYLRLLAEFSNFKKRTEREREEIADYFKSDIIKKMLPVLDDYKRMIEKSADEENEESVLQGAKLIYEKFVQIIEKEGLKKIDALGQPFDPQIHEALMTKSIENEIDDNKVIDVFQEGYWLRDKLLRPAQVAVGKYEKD